MYILRVSLFLLVSFALIVAGPFSGAIAAAHSDSADAPAAPTNFGNGKAYFFSCSAGTGEFYRFDTATKSFDLGYPKPLQGYWGNWPASWGYNIDATLNLDADKLMLFHGDQYLILDTYTFELVQGPTSIHSIPGFPSNWNFVTSAVNWGNGKAYLFIGLYYMRMTLSTLSIDPGYPKMTFGNWPGWPESFIPMAAANPGIGKAYFFDRDIYLQYDIAADQVDPGYPLPIANIPGWPNGVSSFGWRGGAMYNPLGILFIENTATADLETARTFIYDMKINNIDAPPRPVASTDWGLALPLPWGCVDAALNFGNGKAYFFSGKRYLRYDVAADKVDPGYPGLINASWGNWPSAWDRVDAAVYWGNDIAYFFRGSEYLRYDLRQDTVATGYPKPIAGNWPGWPPHSGVNWPYIYAALNFGDGKAYFFSRTEYLQYDVAGDKVDPGFPKASSNNWLGWPDSDVVYGGVTWGSNFPPYHLYIPIISRMTVP